MRLQVLPIVTHFSQTSPVSSIRNYLSLGEMDGPTLFRNVQGW